MAEINVSVPDRTYTVHLDAGILTRAGELVARLGLSGRVLIVTDDTVAALYGEQVTASFRRAGFETAIVRVSPGEGSKSLAEAARLYTKALELELDRTSPIVALGGGVVGDLAGFVAATYLRGVPFIQLPTTLLAQVDASVGGKVAINHPLGKNLIGAFYQPRLVIADPAVLLSLPDRDFAAGLAELLKHGVIADRGLFDTLNHNAAELMGREPGRLGLAIARSCAIKATVVAQDERESGWRMILNFGHTIGHAVEAAAGYSGYRHGEAVAIGMYGAALLSKHLGRCSTKAVNALQAVLERFGLPYRAPDCRPDDLFRQLARDKKKIRGVNRWVLLRDIGEVMIEDQVPEAAVRQVLVAIT